MRVDPSAFNDLTGKMPGAIVYKGMKIGACYRVDLIVEDRVVVEVKSQIDGWREEDDQPTRGFEPGREVRD
jgi:hypothetical protein